MKARKVIQSHNLIEFVSLIVQATKEGWEVDEMNPPSLYGYLYETHVLIDENDVPEAKPTRTEILTTARAAKKAKATAVTESEAPAKGAEGGEE